MQARVIGTAGETVRAKAKTGKGVVSPKKGKARTDKTIVHTSVERQERHEWQQQRQHVQR